MKRVRSILCRQNGSAKMSVEITDIPTVTYRNWNVLVVFKNILQKKAKTRIIEKVLNIKRKRYMEEYYV